MPPTQHHPLNAKTYNHSVKPDNLTRTIRELTGKAASDSSVYELGPGIIYVIELPKRTIRCITRKDDTFPKSFYSIVDEAEIWDNAVADEDRDAYAKSWEHAFAINETRYKARTSRRGAKTSVCEYRSPLTDPSGKLVGAVCRLVDDSFHAMAIDSLVQRSWKQIATAMTRRFLHDFNNTIAGIYSLSELYAEPGSDPASMTEAMEHIRDNSIRSQGITRNIRQIATLENSEPSYFNLEKLVEEQDEYLQALLPKNARIVYELENTEIPVFLDASQFRQAILHLAYRSNEAEKDDIEIRIRVSSSKNSCREKMARIDFSDNRPHVCDGRPDPFLAAEDPLKNLGFEHGIVKSLVKKLGATIEIEQADSRTIASLYIPELEADSRASSSSSAKKAKASKQAPPERSDPPNIIVYTWEDITRHPLLLAMRNAGWTFRIHIDPGQLLIDLSQTGQQLDGILLFKSSLDEKAEPLLSELGYAKNCPEVGVVALGESIDAMPESVRKNCGIVVSGTSKPSSLLNKLAKFYYRDPSSPAP